MEVTGNNRISSDGFIQEENNLIYYNCIYGNAPDDYYDEVNSINIYELMHLMKEWAITKQYCIETRPYIDYDNTDWEICVHEYKKPIYNQNTFNLSKSELDGTTKACEWIKDNL